MGDDPWLDGIRRVALIDLTTFTTTGRRIATPVRFAVDGTRLVVSLDARSGKVKRVRRDPSVEVVGHGTAGPPRSGRLRLLEGDEARIAYVALRRRHPMLYVQRLLLGRRPQGHVTAEITFD